MTLYFDPKEELRLRMADLEKKLMESEEERYRLEKTCNVLMRAFREEEKIRYKTLNKNYEKFLQDCTVRKRRNEIILRSLCRIEDRSRALFAKTERLKLLKDRYISYLKITDIKEGKSPRAWRTIPTSSTSEKTIDDVTPTFQSRVQWKNPLATDYKVAYSKDDEGNSNLNNEISDATPRISYTPRERYEKYNQERRAHERGKNCKTNGFKGLSLTKTPFGNIDSQNKLRSVNNRLDFPVEDPLAEPVRSEEMMGPIYEKNPVNCIVLNNNNMRSELEVKDLTETTVSKKEKNILSQQESIEKLKKDLSFEEELFDNESTDEGNDPHESKIIEKDDTEQNEKNLVKKANNLQDVSLPRINHHLITSSAIIYEGEKQDDLADDSETKMKTENLPMGLDGVDYQNETYPESYYEQPVHHHNHTSIVADVILEEDETEQDMDEEKKDSFEENQLLSKIEANTRKETPERGTDKPSNRPQKNWENETNSKRQSLDKVHDLKEKAINEVKSQESKLEKSRVGKSSDDSSEAKSEKSEENIEKNKNLRSNLIHLLESDSESFQIEHGDAVSGNEDSDFDFSFH